MKKLFALCALMLCLALGLGGCAIGNREAETMGEISLPEPEEEPENMILGETLAGGMSEVSLYYAATDGSGFSTVTTSLRADADQSLPEAAAQALLASAGPGGTRAAGDVALLGCEYACGTATVNLSIDARASQTPQELLALEASIGNTLLDLDGVRAVNVLIGGASESCCQLPIGVQTEPISSVAATYAQLQAERDRMAQLDAAPIARRALVYFPTEGRRWLVPELREITASGGGFATALIDALRAGPRDVACARYSIPEGAELLEDGPVVEALPSGERVLSLNFTSTLANYLPLSGLEVWELAGSLALTMTSFMPELDAVRVMVNDDPVTMCDMGDEIIQFPDGLIRREHFAGRVGSTATLYLVDGANELRAVERAVSTRAALSPRRLLAELLSYAGAEGETLRLPLSARVNPADLLGVQTVGGVARVNLSAGFYRSCQGLSPRAERDLVYAIVNTLCAMEGIRGVRFYVEGRAADTLAGGIYLKSVLLPNPGIVARDDVE